MNLELGCCDRKSPGYLGVDIVAGPEVDIVADLSQCWPWADSSIDAIRAHDIIEHLRDSIHTMNELHRVLKPNARVSIVVPTTDGRGAWQDPQHCSFWNRNSFFYYTAGDPHHTRFAKHYGITAAFRVIEEEQTWLVDSVVKLRIVLEAVK